jgi:hypothetical protein
MTEPKARLLVIGAGVNGSVCAAGLHREVDVSVLRHTPLSQNRNVKSLTTRDTRTVDIYPPTKKVIVSVRSDSLSGTPVNRLSPAPKDVLT